MAEFVVRQAGSFLQPGGGVTLTDVQGDTAYVSYRPGQNTECATCILSPEDFRDLLLDMFGRHASHIKDVRVTVAEPEQ